MTHQVGIIGLGMIGARMLADFLDHPAFEVGPCWDLNPAIGRQVEQAYPQVALAGSAEDVLASQSVNLVYIATPPLTHINYGRRVLASGKALLMEKPLSIDLHAARQLVEQAEASGLPTAMNFAYGAGPVVVTLESLLVAGEVGSPTSIEVRYQYPSWPLPNQLSAAAWITRRSQGGMVREMFSHLVYLSQRLFGKFEVTSALLSYPPGADAAEDFMMATLHCGDLPLRVMGGIGSAQTPRTSDWTLNGTRGSLRVPEGGGIWRATGDSWQEIPLQGDRTIVQARLDALALRLEGGSTPLPTLRDGLEVQEVIEAILHFE